ncbi:MAG TPA: hypothetical protein VMW83_09870 [Spirochaetia bacterium]|nr:hypothetical protein [Spirochaetia bacterium]
MFTRWKRIPALVFAAVLVVTLAGCGPAAPPANPANTQPAFPGAGEIALVQNGNLFLLSAKDSRLHQLTAAGDVSQPGFSPDGQWLSFLTHEQLWLVRSDGSNLHQVTGLPGPVGDRSYVWSPVTDLLAVAPQGSNDGIWQVSPEGTPSPIQGAPKGVSALTWSPDGKQLAFVAPAGQQPSTDPEPPNDVLFTAAWQDNDLTGLQQRYVSAGNGLEPAIWASGGLLFWIDPDHSASIAADGLPLTYLNIQNGRIEKLGVTLAHPEWIVPASPASVYFVQGDGREIWLNKGLAKADLATGKVTDLPLPTGSVYFSPALSPGQKQLAFVFGSSVGPKDPEPNMQTYVQQLSLGLAKPDGTGFQALTGPAGESVPRSLPATVSTSFMSGTRPCG